ncbi:MAG: Fur family transcriptional regulator [Christensenellales bacterium]|jgi:Fe2+ or Zn2+ uptake regulation protein
MTKLQKAILDIVINTGEHLSAEQVYWLVKQKFSSVSLGSVYRNLNRFADANMIRRVARAGAADYYEGNTAPHDHAQCIHCGQMMDIALPNLMSFLKGQISGEVISVDMTVNYICPNCINKDIGKPDGDTNDTA